MVDLSSWFRSERVRRDLDIQDLATLSNLSAAQISRIENGRSEISLNSMIRLAYGLGLDLREVASRMELEVYIPRKKGADLGEGWTVTAQDTRALLNLYRENPGQVKDTMIEAYDEIRRNNPDRVEQVHTDPRTAEIIWRATEATADELVPLPYPQGLTDEHVQSIFLAGGLVTLRDLGAYVRCRRQKKGLSLRDAAAELSSSYLSLYRLESGEIDRISFLEILELERALALNGSLLGIAWRAGEYQTGILFSRLAGTHEPADSWDTREKAYMDAFIAINRWYMVLLPGESKWMDDMHRYLIFYVDREQ